MKKGLIIFFLIPFLLLGQAKPITRILFILDASNSMNSAWGMQTRIQAAKDVINKELEDLRGVPDTEVALRVYGHQSPITNTEQDCNDTKLEVPFGANNLDAIQLKIKSLVAKGATPIARSLEAAAGDFPDTLAKNIIILITDGLESCDNDPCIIAKKLKEKGVKVTPFVIGLGMDLSYLDKFKCIGSYSEAEDKESFRKVFKTILNTILVKTSAQINLEDIKGMPKETNVTMLLYEAGTPQLKYTFVHTLNRLGNPDTVFMDPNVKYDLVVQTIPPVVKNNISLTKHIHNTIRLNAAQGFLRMNSVKSIFNPQFEMRVMQKSSPKTIHNQKYNEINKYLVGTYEVEILTLPRMYKTVEITQSNITSVEIEAPGQLEYKFTKALVAQLYVQNAAATWEWIYNFPDAGLSAILLLQPGKYKMVYRPRDMKSTGYSNEKYFTITSNKTNVISIN
jgi:Ca-activated chloride channel family protein